MRQINSTQGNRQMTDNLKAIIAANNAWADNKILEHIAAGKTPSEARALVYPDEAPAIEGFCHVRDANAQAFAPLAAAHEANAASWPGSCDADD